MKYQLAQECKATLERHNFYTEKLQADGLNMLSELNTFGLKDKEIARNIGVSHIWISKIKNKHRPISVELFEKILKEYQKHAN